MSETSRISCNVHSSETKATDRDDGISWAILPTSCPRTPRMCDTQQEMTEYIEAKLL